MLKKNMMTLITTSLIILLPIAAGLILWNKLPHELPTHWNASGEIDGYSSKPFAVFALPLILLAIHLVCTFATMADPKRKNINGKIFTLVLWICPILSILCGGMTYSVALDINIDVSMIIIIFIGLLFVVLGNYLPKCRHNYTMGIKLPWTLANEENWNRTHRFAGPLWVVGGIITIVMSFIKNMWIFFAIVMLITIIPGIYSYILYRKSK